MFPFNKSLLKHFLPTHDFFKSVYSCAELNCSLHLMCGKKRPCSSSLSMFPARGFMEQPGAQQTGQCSDMPYAPTTTLRVGTMASIAEPQDVASCRCTFLSSSFTERLCWQLSRSAWCLRRNWGEYSAACTVICRQRSSSCGTSLTPVKDQRKVYWKPVPILTGPQKSNCL